MRIWISPAVRVATSLAINALRSTRGADVGSILVRSWGEIQASNRSDMRQGGRYVRYSYVTRRCESGTVRFLRGKAGWGRIVWAFFENLDRAVFHGVNGLARQSALADMVVSAISSNGLFKGGFVMMLWWGLWFTRSPHETRNQERLIATIFLAMVAVAVGRGLQISLPFRLRPIHDPVTNANIPYGMSQKMLEDWSSLPSDHAVLYFALAVGLFRVSRLIGVITLLHAALWVCLPRIYLGLHYPGDLVMGALLGISISWFLMRPACGLVRGLRLGDIHYRWPQYFYPALFLLTFQIPEMFGSVRAFGRTIIRASQMVGT